MDPLTPAAAPQALMAALERSHGVVSRELDREITRHRMTPPQFGVLELLARRGPLPLHEIGKELLVSGGNVTCVIDNLEKAGLVLRERVSGDRRIIKADLTPAGRERLEAIRPAYEARLHDLTQGLTPDEQATLTGLLHKLGLTVCG